MEIKSIIHWPNSIYNRIVETSQNNPTCKLALDIFKKIKPIAGALAVCAVVIYSSDIFHLFARHFLIEEVNQNKLMSLTRDFRDLAKEAGLPNADRLEVYVSNHSNNVFLPMSHFLSPTPRIYVNKFLLFWTWFPSERREIYSFYIGAIARGEMLQKVSLFTAAVMLHHGFHHLLNKMWPENNNESVVEGKVKQFDKKKYARLSLNILGHMGIDVISGIVLKLLILNKPTPHDVMFVRFYKFYTKCWWVLASGGVTLSGILAKLIVDCAFLPPPLIPIIHLLAPAGAAVFIPAFPAAASAA